MFSKYFYDLFMIFFFMNAIYDFFLCFFFNDFFNFFLMGSEGFGKVPASKWCKMQQNQWFSLVFQGFTKQNDGIPGVFASFEGFGRKPGGNHKKII